MIPTTYAPVAAANFCADYIPFEHAAISCAIIAVLSVLATAAAYKVGAWLRRE